MEVGKHNESLESEILGWKAKLDDVIEEFNRMPSNDKKNVVPLLNELHVNIEELTARIENLDPVMRESDKSKEEDKFARFKKRWKEMWAHELPYFRYPHHL